MRKKALSLLLALTLCLTALTPAAALGAGDAPEQPAAQEQTVSGGQETPAGGQDASVSEGPEAPAPGEEKPASEEPEQPASEEQTQPAEVEPEQPASEEEQEAQPTEVEPEQPAAAPVLLAAANGSAVPCGEDEHTAHRVCGDTSCTNEMHTNITDWQATDSLPTQAGHYYLTKDVTRSYTWEPADGTVLCLNGKSITMTGSGAVITVPAVNGNAGKFTLCDCAENPGKITRENRTGGGVKVEGGTFNMYGGIITGHGDNIDMNGVYVCSGTSETRTVWGTFNMYGGTISDNITSVGGGVRVKEDGVFNLYGGSITNNEAGGTASQGGGVYVDGGRFSMYSGSSITKNYPSGSGGQGGGVYVNSGTFEMYGGRISGNRTTIEREAEGGSGGGVYVKDGEFTMTGGTICGNTANNASTKNGKVIGGGGGVYVASSGTFTVSGNAYIAGNKAGSKTDTATAANNVYLLSGQTITVGDKLENDTRIGVTVAGSDTSIGGTVVAVPDTSSGATLRDTDAAKFVSDSGSYRGTLDGTSVKLASVTHSHYLCGGTDKCTKVGHECKKETSFTELWMDADGNLWTGNTVLPLTTYYRNNSQKYYELAITDSSDVVSYYLSDDLDLNYPIYITNKAVSLCLNGHTLRSQKAAEDTSDTNYNVITLNGKYYQGGKGNNGNGGSGMHLNLTDCGTTGKVTHATGEKGSGVCMESGTSFNLFNGSITGNKVNSVGFISGSGGGVYAGGNTFYMYGGSIAGNTADDNGGGVYVGGSEFNLYGGTIGGSTTGSANSASKGGGVYVFGGTFTMSGGEITENTATGKGGGVYVSGSYNGGGTFTMTGGTISENTAANGGGVYVSSTGSGSGTFNVSGGSKITGNTATGNGGGVYAGEDDSYHKSKFTASGDVTITENKVGGANNNVYLVSGKTITVGAALEDSAKIGVTTADTPGDNDPVPVAEPENNSVSLSATNFPSDESYEVQLNEGKVVLAVPSVQTHEHYLCGGTNKCNEVGHNEGTTQTTFAVKLTQDANGDLLADGVKLNTETVTLDSNGNTVTGYKLEAGKNYYLGDNVDLQHPICIASGTVSLCLSGYNLTQKGVNQNVIVISGGSSLNLADCKLNGSEGTVTHGADIYGSGVIVRSGTFNMYGGNITENRGVASMFGIGVKSNDKFNMYGGSITNNSTDSGDGAGVYNNGTFTMYAGTISGSTTDGDGGGVYVDGGTFTMSGGEISGNTTNSNGGGVYVGSGATFNQSGGTISGNASGSFGGGVSVTHEDDVGGAMNMSGGTITGNNCGSSFSGGGVFVSQKSAFTVSGDAKVTGNVVGGTKTGSLYTGGEDNNVYLSFSKITIGTNGMKNGARIGVRTLSGVPVTIAGDAKAGDADYFESDNSSYHVEYDAASSSLILKKGETHTHFLCGESTCTGSSYGSHVTENAKTTFAIPLSMENGKLMKGGSEWTRTEVAITRYYSDDVYALESGTYYLDSDIAFEWRGSDTYGTSHVLYINGDVKLCLNGHSITLNCGESSVIHVLEGKKLVLTDCNGSGEGNGIITHGNSSINGGHGLSVSGTLDLYNGNITQNATFGVTNNVAESANNGGGVLVESTGTVNMYGGRITENTAVSGTATDGTSVEGYGGGVYIKNGGTFNLSGGEISKNTAKGGKGGGVYVADGGTLAVSGTVVISGNKVGGKANNVYLPSGVTMAIGNTLGFDAKIGVTTETAPQKDSPVPIVEDAYNDSDANQIISDNDNYQTKRNSTDNTLELVLSDKKNAGLTFISAPTAKTYGDGNFTVIASAANPGTGGVWKPWSSSDPNVLKIVKEDGGTVTVEVVGAGTATLTATYDSSTTYGTATTTEITVNPATVTVAAKPQSSYVGGTAPDLSSPKAGTHYTVTGLVGDDALVGTVTLKYQKDGVEVKPDTSKAGTYDIVISGVSEPAGGNYKTIKLENGKLTISNRPSSGGGGGGGGASVPTYPVSSSNASASAAVGGSVSTSTKNATAGSTVTVTVSPEAGYRLEKLTVVDKNGKEIPVTLKDGKYTFTMPASQVDIKPVFEKIPAETAEPTFPDVPSSAYYAEPVKWAAEKGITSGTKDGGFAPGNTCTRAQIVTFLWRAAGSPEPQTAETGMTDVSPAAYYAKAVAWAIENGITVGRSDGSFNPNGTCTRANGVTFLYRAAKAAASGNDAGFSDVTADAYYAAAVQWALENGITNGQSNGLFGPDSACTRAQIVTFLYRLYVKA